MTLVPVPEETEDGGDSTVEVKPGIYTEDVSEDERRKKFTPTEEARKRVREECGQPDE